MRRHSQNKCSDCEVSYNVFHKSQLSSRFRDANAVQSNAQPPTKAERPFVLDKQQMTKAVEECLSSYATSNDSIDAALKMAASVSQRDSHTAAETADVQRELRRRITAMHDAGPSAWDNETPAAGQFIIASDTGPPLSHRALKRAFVWHDMKARLPNRGRA